MKWTKLLLSAMPADTPVDIVEEIIHYLPTSADFLSEFELEFGRCPASDEYMESLIARVLPANVPDNEEILVFIIGNFLEIHELLKDRCYKTGHQAQFILGMFWFLTYHLDWVKTHPKFYQTVIGKYEEISSQKAASSVFTSREKRRLERHLDIKQAKIDLGITA